jgi:signal transduction histidine kinase/CheY-like chemotaxis protein
MPDNQSYSPIRSTSQFPSLVPPLVMIADAEIPTAQLLRGVFEREGYRVVMVFDEPQIFAAITEQHPDLIILETRLGPVSGFDILRKLREDPATSAIPTFLLTTHADWPDVLQGLELGADDTMRKPVHPREILARASSKINAHRLEVALQRRTRDLEALLRVSEVFNQQNDWRALPSLILALMYDLLPLDYAALIVLQDNDGELEVEVKAAHPEHMKNDVRRWVLDRIQDIAGVTETVNFKGRQEKDPRNALLLPLSYLDPADGRAYLFAFSDKKLEQNEMQLFEGIGRQANLALRDAELHRFQQNYAEQLEIKVAERTRELQSAQSQLIQAEKLATVGRLAAGIAHEINNPLMPIKFNLESMLEDIQDNRPLEEDLVTVTLESVDRIKRLVQRMLEYNAGHFQLGDSLDKVDINDVVQAMLELTRKTFQQSGKEIVLDLKNVPPVMGNRDALAQVFINLVLNAGEAMEKGGALTISTRRHKDQVLIAFADTGIGIPPEMLDRIFDPFTTTKNTGSGLGLFVSYGIIEGHHGSIKVDSTPNKGTTFTVSLPVATSSGREDQ